MRLLDKLHFQLVHCYLHRVVSSNRRRLLASDAPWYFDTCKFNSITLKRKENTRWQIEPSWLRSPVAAGSSNDTRKHTTTNINAETDNYCTAIENYTTALRNSITSINVSNHCTCFAHLQSHERTMGVANTLAMGLTYYPMGIAMRAPWVQDNPPEARFA